MSAQQPTLILGATSGIAVALARQLAARSQPLYLAARKPEQLEELAEELRRDHQALDVHALAFDALDFAGHRDFYAKLDPAPQVVVVAFGVLGQQEQGQADWDKAQQVLATNFLGAASILELAAADMERRGGGTLVGISSVAGERGRASNYIYGSSKAALTAYMDGMRHRLWSKGVQVLVVKPGFVATRMTSGMDLPAALTAQPEGVAASVVRAMDSGADEVYAKGVWRWIMALVRLLPRPLFHRTSL